MSDLLYGFWDFSVHQWEIICMKHERLVILFMNKQWIRTLSWTSIVCYWLVYLLPDNWAAYILMFILTPIFFLAVSLDVYADEWQRKHKQ